MASKYYHALRVHHCLALHAGGLLEAISRSEWVSAARIRVWHVHALHWICVGLFKSCGRTSGTGRPVMTDVCFILPPLCSMEAAAHR